MRLLVCDDHRTMLEALSMALTDNGHTVVATATDPDAAVAAARDHQPDACLLDMNFPHASGLSAIARIHGVSADTKIVMLSGSISQDLVAAAIALGAQGFVGKEKPVSDIVEALTLVFEGRLAVDPDFLPPAVPSDALADIRVNSLQPQTDREWDGLPFVLGRLSTARAAVRPSAPRDADGSGLQRLLARIGERSRLPMSGVLKADS